jgi:hypothetical protein
MSMREIVWRSTLNHRNAVLPLGPQFILSFRRATFSTGTDNRTQKMPPHKLASSTQASGNPSYPTFSFKDLGASRTVKIVVIAGMSVIGTIESIFWIKVIWAKISPSPQGEPKSDGTWIDCRLDGYTYENRSHVTAYQRLRWYSEALEERALRVPGKED